MESTISHCLSLIGAPSKGAVTADIVQRACTAADTAGGSLGERRWLAPVEAWEAPLVSAGPAAVRDAVRLALSGEPIDINVVPLTDRRKRLLVADMDSTMIEVECIDEFARMAGVEAQVVGITERAMRGELAFEEALRERVAMFAGQPASIIEQTLAERVRYTPGGGTLIATMRAHGAHTALVSGGFTAFTSVVARHLGFNEQHANTLVIEDDRLTGRVAEPILGREAKHDLLVALSREFTEEQTPAGAIAVGDGANDLAMVEAAGLGVAFRAKPVLKAAATAAIDHGDLTALLYLQGYSQTNFRAP